MKTRQKLSYRDLQILNLVCVQFMSLGFPHSNSILIRRDSVLKTTYRDDVYFSENNCIQGNQCIIIFGIFVLNPITVEEFCCKFLLIK